MKLAGFHYQIIKADLVGVKEGEASGGCGEGEEKLIASGFYPGKTLE